MIPYQIISPVAARCSVVALLLFAALLTASCAPDAAEKSPDIQITLEPASVQANDHITVRLADGDGQPITGAAVSIEGNMNHAGMVPVIVDAVQDDADGATDGAYRVPFEFSMMGDWILTVSVTGPDGASYQEDIDVAVDEESITVK